jgi:hypothetical protein
LSPLKAHTSKGEANMADDQIGAIADDDVVVPLRPEQGRPKDPTAAERQARFRQNRRNGSNKKRRKNNGKASTVTPDPAPTVTPTPAPTVTPEPTLADAPPLAATVTQSIGVDGVTPPRETLPGRHHNAVVDIAAYVVAVALAGAAAWFSIRGMIVLFPGSPRSVVIMAIAMESAKLVTAGWLARHWHTASGLLRLVLIVLVTGLAIINATGVYSQLVAAHLGDQVITKSAAEIEGVAMAAKIDAQATTIADLSARINQIDHAVDQATNRGRVKGAMELANDQKRARQELVVQRTHELEVLALLKTGKATVEAKAHQIDAENAPIRYVAAIFGVTDPEEAIRWLIALMVFCCDPLAIALTAAASARR